jgi:hypothetical protein
MLNVLSSAGASILGVGTDPDAVSDVVAALRRTAGATLGRGSLKWTTTLSAEREFCQTPAMKPCDYRGRRPQPRDTLPERSPAVTYEHAAAAHQFESLSQQQDVSLLGMWVFLVTEILFFGGLFLTYAVYRHWYPSAFAAASHEMIVWAGTLNTVVLITSSLTMALAVQAAQTGERRTLIVLLIATMTLGCVFLGVKAFEYRTEFVEGHVPGPGFKF